MSQKKQDIKLLPTTSPNINWFSKFFRWHHTLNMSLHYLVKYLCSKNRHAQEVIEANCHVQTSEAIKPLKKLF